MLSLRGVSTPAELADVESVAIDDVGGDYGPVRASGDAGFSLFIGYIRLSSWLEN